MRFATSYLILTIAYVASGKLGLMLALPPGYISPIFPAAGIAVAAALIGGRRMLPSIFLGSLLLNVYVGYANGHQINTIGLVVASFIAIASTLQAAIGGWSLRRMIGYPLALDHGGEVFRFLLLVPLICLTSASLSVSALLALGIIEPASVVINWAAWWVGDTFGVVVMLPLVMTVAGEPRALWRGRRLTVAIPILLIFVFFVVIFLKATQWEYTDSLIEFRQLSRQAVNQVQNKFYEQETLLEGTAGLLIHDAKRRVTRDGFHRYVEKSLHRFPMIQALEWAPEVDGAQRAGFEAAQREDFPGFEIRERSAKKQLRRAGDRSSFYPVTYAEPLASNEPAVGFDLASNPKRREALTKAIQSGIIVTTPPVHLVQERQQQEGILLLLAVNPRDAKSGVVLTVLRMSEFMDKLLQNTRPMLYTRLVDLDEQETLYDNFVPGPRRTLYECTFDFGTRHYRLETAPTPAYLMQHHGWQSWSVLAAGILSTGLLGALLLLGTGYTARVEAKVEDRTRALKESESRFSNILAHAPIGMAIVSLDGRLMQVNHAFCSILGYEQEELQKLGIREITHPDDVLRSFANLKRLVDGEVDSSLLEKRYLRKGGQVVWGLLASSIQKDDNGALLYIICQIEDITKRHQAEIEVQDQLHFTAQLINSIPNPLFYKDCQGRYLGCNLAFEQFIGSQKEEIIGKSVYDLSPKALADIYYAADKALFDKTGVQTYEAKAQSADGQQRDVLFYKATFDKPDGSLGGLVGIILDITERKQLEKGLKERELLYHTVADYTSDWEYWIMPDGTFRYVSISCEQISGYSPDEFYADPKLLVQIIHPNDKHLYTGHVHHVLSQGVSEPLDFRIQTKGGECRWISHVCQAVYDPAGQLLGQRASNRDITARKLAEQTLAESESRFREIFDTVNDAIFIQDAETGRVIDVNLRMQEMYGYSREEALALGLDDMGVGTAPYSSVEVIEKIRLAQTEGPQVFDWLSRTREGHFFWVEVSLKFALIGKQGRVLAVVRDITKQKDAEARIHHLAYYDLLTDLPNRTLFGDRLQQALVVAKRDKSYMALMFIDLDRFKKINDSLGHHVGDMLLREAAKRMKDCVRESDTLARIGGDEFGVVLQIVNPEQDAMLVAEKIRHALNQPFMLVGKSLNISSSIGIAVYPDHGDDANQLLMNADLAMYHAKEGGRNNVQCYR